MGAREYKCQISPKIVKTHVKFGTFLCVSCHCVKFDIYFLTIDLVTFFLCSYNLNVKKTVRMQRFMQHLNITDWSLLPDV